MKNLCDLIINNDICLHNIVHNYAESNNLLDCIPKFEKIWGISVKNIAHYIISSLEAKNSEASFEFDLMFSCKSEADIDDYSNIDTILNCFKIYKKSFANLINSSDFQDNLKKIYLQYIDDVFDSLEMSFIKSWSVRVKNSMTKYKNTIDESSRYLTVFESSLNPIIIIDKSSKIIDMNTSARKLFYEINGEYFCDGTVYDTLPWLIDCFEEFISLNSNNGNFEKSFETKKGVKYYDLKFINTSTIDNARDEITIIMNNITGYKKITKELTVSRSKYQTLFKNMFDCCSYNKIILDENNNPLDFVILDVNESLINNLGLKRDEIIGQFGSEIFSRIMESEYDWMTNFSRAALGGENIRVKELYLNSVKKWYSVSIYSSSSDHFVFVYSDITEKKLAEEKIMQLAYFDSLTGLPNSKNLDDKIEDSIIDAKNNNYKFAVMFLDIVNFKRINNTLGHNAGDFMLQQIAERLNKLCEQTGTVARLSGDKFVIIHKPLKDASLAGEFAEKILAELKPPFYYNNHELYIESSIGISIYPEDADNTHALKRNADTAMFTAKGSPNKNYQFHTREMNDMAEDRLAMESELRHALKRNEFLLHYQPLVNLKTGMVVGVEALLRWKNVKRGIVPPAEFIPIAESSGLIIPIGEWVLLTACSQCRSWHDSGYQDIYVSVNVSMYQFENRGFVDSVRRILETTGLKPGCLCIEITESIYMQHVESTLKTLNELRNMGVKIFLDDFGTGYSSLNYLDKLPVNTLKIDKSFIRYIDSNWDHAVLTKAIIKMAHSLSIEVVAEGVETLSELSLLKKNKCDKIQGFVFSRPLPPEIIEEILGEKKNLNNIV